MFQKQLLLVVLRLTIVLELSEAHKLSQKLSEIGCDRVDILVCPGLPVIEDYFLKATAHLYKHVLLRLQLLYSIMFQKLKEKMYSTYYTICIKSDIGVLILAN